MNKYQITKEILDEYTAQATHPYMNFRIWLEHRILDKTLGKINENTKALYRVDTENKKEKVMGILTDFDNLKDAQECVKERSALYNKVHYVFKSIAKVSPIINLEMEEIE